MLTEHSFIEALTSLHPILLHIRDDSELHAGHVQAPGHALSHVHLTIVSTAFSNLSAVARHRLVYQLLTPLWSQGLHAVQIKALTPTQQEADSS